jgi:hypothetical protein
MEEWLRFVHAVSPTILSDESKLLRPFRIPFMSPLISAAEHEAHREGLHFAREKQAD